jgi:hypothetical protein
MILGGVPWGPRLMRELDREVRGLEQPAGSGASN